MKDINISLLQVKEEKLDRVLSNYSTTNQANELINTKN